MLASKILIFCLGLLGAGTYVLHLQTLALELMIPTGLISTKMALG